MLMLTKTHAAVVATKDAEIAGLMKRLETADGARRMWMRAHEKAIEQVAGLREDVRQAEASSDALTAQLAVFTAPRARNERGHFISAKGASA